MTLEQWLRQAKEDARQRGLPELDAPLEMLAQATSQLRQASWNQRADGGPRHPGPEPHGGKMDAA